MNAGTGTGTTGNAEQAECKGIHEGIQWRKQQGFSHREMESDCQNAVKFLNTEESNIQWENTSILYIANKLKASFELCIFRYCNRNSNVVAHLLAAKTVVSPHIPSSSSLGSSKYVSFKEPPSYIKSQLKRDSFL